MLKRIINFRVRNVNYDCWLKPEDFIINGEGHLIIYNHLYDDADEYIIQQFVGVEDKNGKEIYEGDIIGIRNLARRKIEFMYGAFCARDLRYEKFDWDRDMGLPGNLHGQGNPWTIMGNIFENPELL